MSKESMTKEERLELHQLHLKTGKTEEEWERYMELLDLYEDDYKYALLNGEAVF